MELCSKLSENSFELSTKRQSAAIVLVGLQSQRTSLLDNSYYSNRPFVALSIKMQDLH